MIGIPAKPEGSVWTDDQWKAIVLRGSNMLVAAAAGSGKTAVLVERIIRRISDEQDPVDVDRLLVATFTKAAAAEMRHRIREALEKELYKRPESDHLRRQLALLNRASITTIHSFCMEVIRRYFALIHLDPGFRVADETEAELLRQEVLEELLEERYAEAEEDSPFWGLVERFGGERSDEPLLALIARLYDASRSHPFPERWLRSMAGMFDRKADEADAGSVAVQPWIESLMKDVRLELAGAAALLESAVGVTEEPGGPAPYRETLEDELALIRYLEECAGKGWRTLYEAFQTAAFGKLKPCRGDAYDKELQEQAKQLRTGAKDKLNLLKEELFGRSPERFAEELAELSPLIRELARLTEDFAAGYKQAKSEKNLVDFADLEHYCLQILSDPEGDPGVLTPSRAAAAYREQFVEILLDEYQDTNAVQEAIVSLISREGPGNRFMVGDVKQSIYRFRLAEPGLFLEKYRTYAADGQGAGRRIDLARNFRSRRQVVDGVNFLFRQVMNEAVGEMEYDRNAELVCGASYPEGENGGNEGDSYAVECLLIDRGEGNMGASAFTGDGDGENETPDSGESEGGGPDDGGAADLETAQLEARLIGRNIRKFMGLDGEPPFLVSERNGDRRPPAYRDFVILLRATHTSAPVFIEELKQLGIPAYADIGTGYFSATEVETVLSLLKLVDNPYQDIPLAAVLRSPIVGLTADELARVRLVARKGSFYDALLASIPGEDAERAADTGAVSHMFPAQRKEGVSDSSGAGQISWDLFVPLAETAAAVEAPALPPASDAAARIGEETARKLKDFVARLERWRTEARQGSLADLIWSIYRETGYFDYAGGLPGGVQRQANLRALYDRARQYEATSFRGLFRFLRFVERMRDGGSDLGTARALGEQEDVVRIMSIHKSKGLEFPVVFVAGMGKRFNRQDLNGSFLIHKELGFGPAFTDMALRVSCPTLPQLAIRRRMRMEMLAEEMRVLYVALTRAKEKLFLIGTVPSAEKALQAWARAADGNGLTLPDHELAQAQTYLDWVGPAVLRHPGASELRKRAGVQGPVPPWASEDGSRFAVGILYPSGLILPIGDGETRDLDEELLRSLRQGMPLARKPASPYASEVERRLSWRYPFESASRMLTKTSVSELKRLSERRAIRLSADEWEWGAGAPPAEDWAEGPPLPADGSSPVPGQAGSIRRKDDRSKPAFLSSEYRKPQFLGKRRLSAAEIGTLHHEVMQHAPLHEALDEEGVRGLLRHMVDKGMMTEDEAEAVRPEAIAAFWDSNLGRRLSRAQKIHRELPFSYGLRAGDVYPETGPDAADEIILIQGVIDCLFEDDSGLVLLDYKTDAVRGLSEPELAAKYRVQLGLYARAIEHIWRRKVDETYLYFFDGPHLVRL